MTMKKKRLLGILLSLALVLSLMPGMRLTAYAEGEKAYAAYDVTTETNKTKSDNDLTALQVTFNERQWYIIEDNSSSATSGTVTLLSADTTFGTKTFDADNYSNKYSTSQVKTYLDSMTVTGGAFAGVAEAIETVDLTTNQYNSNDVYETVNNVKLYLLCSEEANSLPKNVRKAEFTGGNCNNKEWWLRSPGDRADRAAYVYGSDGDVDVAGTGIRVSWAFGVRPALKLDLSSVIFDSESNTFTLKTAEYTVTYKVVGGTWSDGTTADKTETVQSGSTLATVPTGMKAKSGYTGGAWDRNPAEVTITGDTTFTYTFTKKQAETNSLYRIYNPNSGEHFFTTSAAEKNNLVKIGWRYEGVAWSAPKSGTPVLRLYNPNAGDHHYTTSTAEKNNLVKVGWRYEGVAFYSGGSKPIYRAYNPNAVSGAHHFTISLKEKNNIVKAGWRYEGVGFYTN